MVKRYDKNKLKKIISIKLTFGIIFLVLGIIGFILIEYNLLLDELGFQVLSTAFVCIGLLISSLIGIELRKNDIENNYLKLEKYIAECDTYVSLLYKMYLNNYLSDELSDRGIKICKCFPIMWEDSFEVEIINNDKKLIIVFSEDKIMYTILKVDKYGFDINEAQWKEESLKEFKENNEIIDYIEEKYYQLKNRC